MLVLRREQSVMQQSRMQGLIVYVIGAVVIRAGLLRVIDAAYSNRVETLTMHRFEPSPI
jgi:hypothetical protein